MDALDVTIKPSTLAPIYLLVFSCLAVATLADSTFPFAPAILLLILALSVLEWYRHIADKTRIPQAIRYRNATWCLKFYAHWYAVDDVRIDYHLPWLLVLRLQFSGQPRARRVLIWRDSVQQHEWRLLRIYLAL